MKRLALSLGLFCLPATLYAALEVPSNLISASGSATVYVRPDSARVYFGVESLEKTLKAARQDNNRKIQKTMDAIQDLKIPDTLMKTANVNVQLVQPYRNDAQLPQTAGYRLSNQITVVVKHKDPNTLASLAAKVLDAGLENGVNSVQQIQFFKEDDTAARREALERAVQDAIENAKAMAKGAGKKYQDVKTLSTSGGHAEPAYRFSNAKFAVMSADSASGESTPVVAGTLEITATVEVTASF